jgi:hypothetical protein
MKFTAKTVLAAALLLAGATMSHTALAHRTSVGVGFSFGFPGYWYGPGPYWYPPAYPYPYYPAYYPATPTTYVEQGALQAPAEPQEQWWYYCVDARAYYPYVRECAGGWQRVAPTPPPAR